MQRWYVAPTEESEIAAIARLEKEIFSDAWSERAVKESWIQNQTILLTLREGEETRVIGYAILYYVLDEAEIARIAVRSETRRCGAGTYLFSEILRICREKQITKILLDVRQSNQAAIAFYRRQGFAEDGIRKCFYEHPKEDAVLMSMDTDCQIMH